MEEDVEDSDCVLIDDSQTEPEQPVKANSRQLNATETKTSKNNEETIRNDADSSPSNVVSLLKNFNLERFRNNNPHIFDDSNEETHQNIELGKKQSNGARVFCKDFSRIPFDSGSNLLAPEYLASSELYAHLVGNTDTTRSAADPVQSRNNGNSTDFQPTANNFTNNARRASDTFIQIPSPTEPYRVPQTIPPNTVYGNADPTGLVNTNTLNVIGNPSTSIPPNRSGFGIRGDNMAISIPVAQNLNVIGPHPGDPTSTAHGAEVSSNVDRLNGLIINNCLPPAMNFHNYRPVPPRQCQELYASDANRRQMYGHNLAAPSANYGPNIGRCQYACCTGPCAPINMSVTPTSALPTPTNYIPNRASCTCPGSYNVHRSGPLYPTAHPNVQAPPNFSTTTPRNPYGQALNGNNAVPREGLYRVEDPITYANYQQAYLAEMRRNSYVAEQSTINTVMRQHIPVPAMNQRPKAKAATNPTRACAKINTNHVDPGIPAISASYHEATCSGNSNNITNSEAVGIKNTVKIKGSTEIIKKTSKAKTKAVKKSPRARAPTSNIKNVQINNIATTQVDKQNINLEQPTMEMRIPTEHGEIKLAYNISDASIMQAPLSHELHLQNNMHNDIDQAQLNKRMQTIEQIIMDAVDMAMQNNMQQTENVTEKVQTSMNTETYKKDTLKRNVDSSVALSNMNKSGASTSGALTSGPVVSASSKGFELRTPASFTGVEVIRDNIESIDLTTDSGTRHDKLSININKVQTPNTQQAGMSINSENAQIPLIMEACPQYPEMSMNTKIQQASMNSNRVQTLISKKVYTTQQDKVYTNVVPALASYMNNCETSTSVPHISKVEASNVCEHKMLTSTAAKGITSESRTNTFNAYTDTPLDRMSLTTNKAKITITSEHSKITNNETSKMVTNAFQEGKQSEMLTTTVNPRKDIKKYTIQPATNVNQVKMCMNTETGPTSISTEASVQPANMNTNVKSLQPPSHLNKNNLGTQVTAPWNSETTIQQSNTCEIKVPALSSTVKGDGGLYLHKIELESRPNVKTKPNTILEVSTEQDNTTTNNNVTNTKIPLIMKEYPQQAEISMNLNKIQSDVTMQTHIQQTRMDSHTETVQTSRTSNTCHLTYTTSSIESVTHDIENTDFASSFNNLNPRTGLMSSVPRSDTIYDTTQTQAIVQHHETDQTVDHISIDFLKSILQNVHWNATLQNITKTNIAKTKVSVHEQNINEASNNNSSNAIPDELPAVKEIKDNEGTETIKNKYTTGTVSEGNITSHKSKSDEENDKLKIARQHLALLNMQNGHDNAQKNIVDEYGSIISSVLKRVNISQTSYEVSLSEQDKSMDSCITNRIRSSANIKSLETRKRKVQNDREIKNNKIFIKDRISTPRQCLVPAHHYEQKSTNTVRSTSDIKTSRKKKIQNAREINKNSDSGSTKRYRRGADTKQNNKYTRSSRPVQKPATNKGINLQRTVLTNQEKHKRIIKEKKITTHKYLVPRHHYEQQKFVDKNSCSANTVRSFRKIQNDRVFTNVSRKAVDASKIPYRHGTDIKQKNNYTLSSRPVQTSVPKLQQTDVEHKVKNNGIKEGTISTSLDEIIFFKFQIEFFRRLQEHLMTKGLGKSAEELSFKIYNLIYISENEDAKADLEFECPKCHYVSIYSPCLLYCKEDVHNLDESNKPVHCHICIRFRKKYITSLKKYIRQNNKQFETIIDDKHVSKENNIKPRGSTVNNNELKTQSTYNRTDSDSTHSTIMGGIINQPKIDTGSKENNTKTDEDTIHSNELKTQSTYTRTDSESTHSTDIGHIINQAKIDAGSQENIAITDEDTIHSNELKTQSTYTRTDSESTHSTDIGDVINQPKIDYDAIEEQLNMITYGVSSFPTKGKMDVQNKNSKIKLLVKLPCHMLKPSIVESLIKLKHDTTIASINDIDNKDKNCAMNLEVQRIITTKSATEISTPRNKDLKTTTKSNDSNVDNNEECHVISGNADKNRNIERNRKVSPLNDVETTTSINANLPRVHNVLRNTNNTNDESTCRITKSCNKDTAKSVNDDNNKNKISRKVSKSLSIETAIMRQRKINTGTNNNNHEKNISENREARIFIPDVDSKPKNTTIDVQKNTDSRKNKSPVSYRVTKATEKNNKVKSRRTNDKDEENYRRGEDDRKSSSESDDNGNDSNETDDEINKTAKAVDSSFKTLKNNCNSNKKSDLPQVHISGKEDKSSKESKNYATVKDEYSYKCHVCTSSFSYLRWYYNHMRNSHGILNESVPEACVYKKCAICGLKTVQAIAYNSHIRTCHGTTYRTKN